MTRLLEFWLFINYCGQKIGQFKGADLKNSLLNVLVSQIAPLLFIPAIFIYIGLGFRNFYLYSIIIILVVWLTRIFLKKKLIEHLSINDLEFKYKSISKKRRIFYFSISILLTASATIIFGYSMFFLKWLK